MFFCRGVQLVYSVVVRRSAPSKEAVQRPSARSRLCSTDTSYLSADRATLDVLNETFFTYLGGLNYFSDDDEQSKLTYADLKEHIGVDCSDYCYDEAYQRGIYTWYADEDDACSLSLFFGDNGKLIAAGAYNLS